MVRSEMDQVVGFCKGQAGRIAYATVGEGSPLLFPAWWVSHLELTWANERFRAFIEALAARHAVIRYDPIGSGLSERRRAEEDFSLQAELEVLDRLFEHLDLERCSLFGFSMGGPLAISFAAARPERVKRLILYGTYADGSKITDTETRRALSDLTREHWDFGSRMLTSLFLPPSEPEEARWLVELLRTAADANTTARLLSLSFELDASSSLPGVVAPTLVLHRRHDRNIPYKLGVELAAGIPGASFQTLEGELHFPWLGDTASVLAATAEFTRLGPYSLPGTRREEVARSARETLSDRELEVLGLIAAGLSDREIAEQLVLSPHTVHRHVANVRAKLGQSSRAGAVAEGNRLGLI
jgi:pimeloyl-ACP methyl ester carboxylesterase/DNA-binding CsgD family transcriptional regulator